MEFVIKKKNLKWIILGIALVLIIGSVSFRAIYSHQQAVNEKRILQEDFERSTNREYESLLRDYERYVKEYNEGDYYDREFYKKELYDLLGTYLDYYPEYPSEEIDEILKSKAESKAIGLE